jgi:hypothetical protein
VSDYIVGVVAVCIKCRKKQKVLQNLFFQSECTCASLSKFKCDL